MGKKIIHDFIALDVETSGLNFRTDQIIEICVVRVRNDAPSMVFNTLVRPSEELRKTGLNPKVTELTGHTMEDLEGGISELELAHILDAMIRPLDELAGTEQAMNATIVAYNATFDLGFIDSLFVKEGFDPVENDFIDPLTIARDRSTYPHTLAAMCKKMGIDLQDAHSAHDDTMALVELFMTMNDEDSKYEKPVAWYFNKVGYKRKFEAPDWVPNYAELYPQGPKPDIIEQKKPRTATPKYAPVVVNNAEKRKKRPDFANMPTEEFAEAYLPTRMLQVNMPLALVKTLIEDPFSEYHTGQLISISIPDIELQKGIDDYAEVIHYLVTEARIPEKTIITFQDDPEKVVIEFRKPYSRNYTRVDEDPFAAHNRKGPIEISEDDLPF